MKCIVFILSLLFSSTMQVFGESGQKTFIFSVNLFTNNMDLRLGYKEQPLFQKNNQEAYSATLLVQIDTPGEYPLFYRSSGNKEWVLLADAQKAPLLCAVKAGKIHCILIDKNGQISFQILDLPDRTFPVICFLNGTSDPIARMEVGVDWAKGTAVFAEQLPPFSVTDFRSFKAGYYSLFWQFDEQIDTGAYYIYPDQEGKEYEVFHFQKAQYYLFSAMSKEGADYAVLFNITGG